MTSKMTKAKRKVPCKKCGVPVDPRGMYSHMKIHNGEVEFPVLPDTLANNHLPAVLTNNRVVCVAIDPQQMLKHYETALIGICEYKQMLADDMAECLKTERRLTDIVKALRNVSADE